MLVVGLDVYNVTLLIINGKSTSAYSMNGVSGGISPHQWVLEIRLYAAPRENFLQSLTCAYLAREEPVELVRKSFNCGFSGKGQSHVVGGVDLLGHVLGLGSVLSVYQQCGSKHII